MNSRGKTKNPVGGEKYDYYFSRGGLFGRRF